MRRVAVTLFAFTLIVRGLMAWPQYQPGYMDEAYYFVNAATLARGGGLSEDFVWNYIAHPTTLPQPSNAYWMPLTSFVLAPALWLFGEHYRVAQIEMLFLSALLVPLTYLVSMQLFGNVRWALVSALLMLVSGLYLPYWAASDSFALYALLGSGVLLLAAWAHDARKALACGILVGLAHLTRADGVLLALPALLLWWQNGRSRVALAALVCGYGIVMAPWLVRNESAFGVPLLGGSSIFMREYNDLFLYERPLTPGYWLNAGWVPILQNVARAFVLNLATLAGALQFLFFPFALIGLWCERRRSLTQGVLAYLVVLFAAMTLVFSLSGPRGTFLHSLVAALPLLYVFAPPGLWRAIGWIAQRRPSWRPRAAETVFSASFLMLAALVSVSLYRANIFGDERDAGWNDRFDAYRAAAEYLTRESGDALSPVACIAPPAFVYFAQRPAIAIPSDDPLALVHAAQQFAVRYVIVEPDHPAYMDAFYSSTVADPRFQRLATITTAGGTPVQLYQIIPLH